MTFLNPSLIYVRSFSFKILSVQKEAVDTAAIWRLLHIVSEKFMDFDANLASMLLE